MKSRTPPARTAAASVCLVVALGASGCVMVKPTQRGQLAQPEMNPATAAGEETFHSHVEAAREASFGGHGAAGGGCGCG